MTTTPTSTLDKRICPGCGRRPRRVHACAHCGWTAYPGKIPTVRELLDGTADGFIADGVDLGRFARALLRDARGVHDLLIGALLAGPMPTAAHDCDNICNTGHGPDGATP